MRDDAGAARLIEGGRGRSTRSGSCEHGVLTDQPLLLTPLEAAVLVDAAAMLDFLRRQGRDGADRAGVSGRRCGRARRARQASAMPRAVTRATRFAVVLARP